MVKLFNVSEVAEMLGLSTSCLYKKAEKGELEAIKIGTALRFSENNIQAFLDKCRMGKNMGTAREMNVNPGGQK